jgi:hypothetical protein
LIRLLKMRLVRVCNNIGNVIRSYNEHTLSFYNRVNTSKFLYNTKPSYEINDNKNIAQKMDDIDNSLQITCNKRPYTLYFLMHELHHDPTSLYIRHWVDFKNNEVRALCIMDQIDYSQINWCNRHRRRPMIIEELNFMFILCHMQHTNKTIF